MSNPERNQKALTAMNIAGLKSFGYELQPDGSVLGVDIGDIIGLSQNGARISVRWARLAGIPRQEFLTFIESAWEQQTAEDDRDQVRATKTVVS